MISRSAGALPAEKTHLCGKSAQAVFFFSAGNKKDLWAIRRNEGNITLSLSSTLWNKMLCIMRFVDVNFSTQQTKLHTIFRILYYNQNISKEYLYRERVGIFTRTVTCLKPKKNLTIKAKSWCFQKFQKQVNRHLLEYFRGIQEVLNAFEKAEKSREVSQEKIIKLKGKDSLIRFIIKLRSPLTLIGMSQYAIFLILF